MLAVEDHDHLDSIMLVEEDCDHLKSFMLRSFMLEEALIPLLRRQTA